MDKMFISPYKVISCYISADAEVYSDECVRVGLFDEDKLYGCTLYFNTALFDCRNSSISSAVLRMFCCQVNTQGALTCIYLKINNCITQCQCIVTSSGIYEWDLTEYIKGSEGNIDISLFTSVDEYSAGKEFSYHSGYPINLEIHSTCSYDDKTYQWRRDYLSTNSIKYSAWIKCSGLSKYSYSVYNFGEHDVQCYIEISPDKKYTYVSSPVYDIGPKEIVTFEPYKYNFYIRVAYKNMTYSANNPISIWFQAQNAFT